MGIPIGETISGLGDIYAGFSALQEGKAQASLLEEQGALTKDDYFAQASLVRDAGHRVRAKQTMEYISSGVEAVGTPQMLARETLNKYMKQSGSLETTGVNYERLYQEKAKMAKKEGQAAFVSSIFKAAGSIVGAL
jgi:hypothetical protein